MSENTIGKLAVEITLDDSQFQQEIEESQGELETLALTLERLGEMDLSFNYWDPNLLSNVDIMKQRLGDLNLATGEGRIISKEYEEEVINLTSAISSGAGIVAAFAGELGEPLSIIGAVAEGVGLAVTGFNTWDEEAEKLLQRTADLQMATTQLGSIIELSASDYQTATTAMGGNASKAKELIGNIEELDSVTIDSAKGNSIYQKQMDEYLSGLKDIYPYINAQIDENTGLLNMNAGQMRELAEYYGAEQGYQTALERTTELTQQKTAAEDALAVVQDQRMANQKILGQNIRTINDNELVQLTTGEQTIEMLERKGRELTLADMAYIETAAAIRDLGDAEEEGQDIGLEGEQLLSNRAQTLISLDEQVQTAIISEGYLAEVEKELQGTVNKTTENFDSHMGTLDELQLKRGDQMKDIEALIGAQSTLAASTAETNTQIQEGATKTADVTEDSYGRIQDAQAEAYDPAAASQTTGAYWDAAAAATEEKGGALSGAATNVVANSLNEAMGADFGALGSHIVQEIAHGMVENAAIAETLGAKVELAGQRAESEIAGSDFPGKGNSVIQQMANGAALNTSFTEIIGTKIDYAKANAQSGIDAADFSTVGSSVVEKLAEGIAGSDALDNAVGETLSDGAAAAVTAIQAGAPEILAEAGNLMASLSADVQTTMADIISYVEAANAAMPKIKIEFDRNIALPHFSMSGKLDGKTGAVPSVGVNWYDKGGLFTDAQLIGVAEKRPEFVGAAEDLETFIGKSVESSLLRVVPGLTADIARAYAQAEPQSASSATVNHYSVNTTVNAPSLNDGEVERLTYHIDKEIRRLAGL